MALVRRLRIVFVALAAAVTLLVPLRAPVQALPPYQPQCSTLAVSTTMPEEGATITVSGRFFTPGAVITLVLHSQTFVLGTVTVAADGTFTASVTLPHGVTGAHLIIAEGQGNAKCPADPIQIQIQGGHTPNGTGGTGTSTTGVDVAMLLAVALGLIGVGVLVTAQGRARGRHRVRTATGKSPTRR